MCEWVKEVSCCVFNTFDHARGQKGSQLLDSMLSDIRFPPFSSKTLIKTRQN